MRAIILKNNANSIERATKILERNLKEGDIILTGPIPKNLWTRFFNIILMITRKISWGGITHCCLYLGNNSIFDIDHKFIEEGKDFFKISVKGFIKRKIRQFGGVMIYVVQPKVYKEKHRKLVILETIKNFINRDKHLKHSYLETIKVGLRFIFKKNDEYKEDLDLVDKRHWTCAHVLAYIFKKSGVNIGARASYTFIPCMFAFNKEFKVKRKIVLE